MKILLFLLPLVATASAAWPRVGPDYSRPAVVVPPDYRDAGQPAGWKIGEPADQLARGAWWTLFSDPVLNDLETRALAANQQLRAAAARVEEARAAAGVARSGYWPQIAASGSVTRERTSTTTGNVFPETLTTTYGAPLTATWELDLFGRQGRLVESARDDAASREAEFESVRLALTAEVASNYFSLRAFDQELALVRDTLSLRQRAVDLVAARVRSGTAADLDLARAETERAIAEADQAGLEASRSSVQSALALLIGEPAPGFVVAEQPSVAVAPDIPAGLPSDLLERRPDIAAAERALAAANARIGVAKAAFFPAVSLTGAAGYASADLDRLFESDSRAWSIGPRLYLPIFQGGRNRRNLERSRAAYDESVARYRQSVLLAFRDVQDALTSARFLAVQLAAQERAIAAGKRSLARAGTRYDAGFVSYLEVIDAQRTALELERAGVRLGAQRLNVRVALIKALGGGWRAAPDGRLASR